MNDFAKREVLVDLVSRAEQNEAVLLLGEALAAPTAAPIVDVSEVDAGELASTYAVRERHVAQHRIPVVDLDLFVQRLRDQPGMVCVFGISTDQWHLIGVADGRFERLVTATAVATRT